jgi:hypothetical protein
MYQRKCKLDVQTLTTMTPASGDNYILFMGSEILQRVSFILYYTELPMPFSAVY